jgi:hypothetical protein
VKGKIKYLILCLVLAALVVPASLSAQHYIGVKGGGGSASGRFYPDYETKMLWGKYTGGVMWKYYSAQQVVGGVSVELEYQTRGYQLYEGHVSDTTYYRARTRAVSTITMPIIWQPHMYFAKQRVRLFINAGVTFSYNLGIGDTLTEYEHFVDSEGNFTHETTVTTPYTMNNARDGRWNYGICAGLGVGVMLGPCEVFVEGRYYFGMSDILRTKTRYQFNEQGTIRSELDNIYFTVGVFFKISRGGIKEPPLVFKRKAERMRDDDFRNIKLDNMKY